MALFRGLVGVVVVAVTVVAPAPVSAQASRFGDVAEGAFYSEAVASLDRVGVFVGTECDGGFCPEGVMDRKTMAVWVVRVLGRQDPPGVTESGFDDVDANSFFTPFIEKLADLEITTGCGDGTRFCPDDPVTRAEMAAFLSRAYNLAEGPDPGFGDVDPGDWFADHVARLAASGITRGCGDGTRFCPGDVTTRAETAVLLWRAETAPVVLAAGACGGAVDDGARLLVDESDAAAWSPDCSRIVYAHRGSLWVMNNDGSRPRRLVSDNDAWLNTPAWSPDGARIAYGRASARDGIWVSHIWTVGADGANRTRVSRGDVSDAWPSWSPLGDRLVFQRFSGDGRDERGDFVNGDHDIVVANAAGGDELVLTEGSDRWEMRPVWSPDGSRIAYESDGVVWLIDPDGTDATRVLRGAWDGGSSWAPDGTRIAFAQADGDGSSIVIADIDGLNRETITGSDEVDLTPRWSPDGQRIIFTRRLADGRQQLHVVGASGAPVPINCRPLGGAGSVGFPLYAEAVPAEGAVRIAVLFMDFPDAEAAHTTQTEAALGLPWAEAYLEAVSYGQLDIEFVPLHRWLRATRNSAEYSVPTDISPNVVGDASIEAVALADDEFDFSTVNMVLTVFPSSHFGGGNAGGSATADSVTLQTTRANTFKHDEANPPAHWGYVGAHEIAHVFGLADLYPFDGSLLEPPDPPDGSVWAYTDWGLMGLRGLFQTHPDDPRLRVTWRFPDGGTSSGSGDKLEPREMLAWSRWQLGWLQEAQVLCMTQPEATVTLAPVATPGTHLAMVAVPINSHEVIVIESRRQLGYDHGNEYPDIYGDYITIPGLATEGVLVYTVDSLIEGGSLPIKLAGDSGNLQLGDFPVLQPGDSITIRGYTITVTADNGQTHTVTITQDS